MILFAADDHFGMHPGKNIFEGLRRRNEITFVENDPGVFGRVALDPAHDLLILHQIGKTCDQEFPDEKGMENIRRYCENGGNLLLLHGSSAAFWHCDWWRELVGFRWVRPGDPDGVVPSTHPHAPCTLRREKIRHPLAEKLPAALELPEDEIYIELEQTAPLLLFMTADVNFRTYPQCVETRTASGGRILSFIPGHRPEITTMPGLRGIVDVLIDDLAAPQ